MFARIGQLQRSPQGNLGKIELSTKQWELPAREKRRWEVQKTKMQLKLQKER